MKIGSKRRRTRQEIDDDKLESATKQQALEAKLKNFERLQQENQALQQQAQENAGANELVASMMAEGFIVQDGDGNIGPSPNIQMRK